MSIPVYPYKLNEQEMELRLGSADVRPVPGQLVRLEGVFPAYGQITGLRGVSTETPDAGYLVRVQMLYGTPNPACDAITLLDDRALARELQALLGDISQPLPLSPDLTLDLVRMGSLTLIEGDDIAGKLAILNALVEGLRAYRRVLIIDPLGVFTGEDAAHISEAGPSMGLNLAQVNVTTFLETLSKTVPNALQAGLLARVGAAWPNDDAFISFSDWAGAVAALDQTWHNLIQNRLLVASRAGVFAEDVESALSWEHLMQDSVNVLDISGLPEPWRQLYYQTACDSWAADTGEESVLVAIYPENQMGDGCLEWLARMRDHGLPVVGLLAWPGPRWNDLADNLCTVDSDLRWTLQGQWTLDLPVSMLLPPLQPLRSAGNSPVHISQALPSPSLSASEAYLSSEATASELAENQSANIAGLFTETDWPEPQLLGDAHTDVITSEQPPASVAEIEERYGSPDFSQPVTVESLESTISDVTESFMPENPEPSPDEQASSFWPTDEDISNPGSRDREEAEVDDEFNFSLDLDPYLSPGLDSSEPEMAPFLAKPSATLAGAQSLPDNDRFYNGPPDAERCEEPGVSGEMPRENREGTPETESAGLSVSGQAAMSADEENMPQVRVRVDEEREKQPYEAGNRVSHPEYGVGMIQKVMPMDDSVILNVMFESVGKRLLDPALTTLEKV